MGGEKRTKYGSNCKAISLPLKTGKASLNMLAAAVEAIKIVIKPPTPIETADIGSNSA